MAKLQIGEIGDLDSGSDSWLAMTVLIESVEHHIDEEEEELFPSVKVSTDATRPEKLRQEFDEKRVSLRAVSLADKLQLSATDPRGAERVDRLDRPYRRRDPVGNELGIVVWDILKTAGAGAISP